MKFALFRIPETYSGCRPVKHLSRFIKCDICMVINHSNLQYGSCDSQRINNILSCKLTFMGTKYLLLVKNCTNHIFSILSSQFRHRKYMVQMVSVFSENGYSQGSHTSIFKEVTCKTLHYKLHENYYGQHVSIMGIQNSLLYNNHKSYTWKI